MTAVEAAPGPLSFGQSSLIKMEERKRPISYDQSDAAPPLKKQATAPNGASKSHLDDSMPKKDEIEVSRLTPSLLCPNSI
jgi:E3 ubiquitin-protein ligase BRE1